jgi:hypothetical protein
LELSGGNRRQRRRSRIGAAGLAAALALTVVVGGCGGGSSSNDSSNASGTYRLRVVTAEFPTEQRLGETTLMRIGVRNVGDRTMPALTVSVTIAGKEGETSSLPFAIRDPQPGLAQPDRPVWVLAEHYPKVDGSSEPGGTENASRNTYNFGSLKPGETTEGVWKLSASRTGRYTVLYKVGAGLTGEAKAETRGGVEPGGSFTVRITAETPNTTVNDKGEVVEIGSKARSG